MSNRALEECITARSHAIWEREGRPAGHENDYWERARREIEREMHAALEGRETDFVPPRLEISRRPIRYHA